MKNVNEFPPGWDEKRVQAVIQHYESQTEDEAVAENEAAREDTSADHQQYYAELGLIPPEAPAKAAG